LGSYNKYKREICTKEGEGVPIVEKRERESTRVHTGATEKRIYLTLKVALNGTSILCREEGQKEENGTGL